jgi:hypothetical protein
MYFRKALAFFAPPPIRSIANPFVAPNCFLTISSSQKTITGKTAVKSVEYAVSDEFREGFYDSCKSVQFGATNGFAM